MGKGGKESSSPFLWVSAKKGRKYLEWVSRLKVSGEKRRGLCIVTRLKKRRKRTDLSTFYGGGKKKKKQEEFVRL